MRTCTITDEQMYGGKVPDLHPWDVDKFELTEELRLASIGEWILESDGRAVQVTLDTKPQTVPRIILREKPKAKRRWIARECHMAESDGYFYIHGERVPVRVVEEGL